MALSINWATLVIFVPQADLNFIGGDVWGLDVNAFRLELKDIEDSIIGMAFLDTHRHNTEVLLSGVTFARIFEIINGYTVEFEDGNYSVSASGANHNIADVKVVNQVSLIVNNAAGLISNPAIEFGEFGGGVHIDVINGSTGTFYPKGTLRDPVNNLVDAKTIAAFRGFDTIKILGDFTFLASDSLDGFKVIGDGPNKTAIILTAAATITNCSFERATISGTMDGGVGAVQCFVGTLINVDGILFECQLNAGTITLDGAEAAFINCWSGVPGFDTPIIDMGGTGTDLLIRNYHGGLKLINHTSGSDNVSIDMNSGHVILDSTISSGTFIIRGITKVTDNSTSTAVIDSTDAVVPARLTNIQNIIESLRDDHTAYGNIFYWDPVDGLDSNDGTSPIRGIKTLQHAIDNLVIDSNHDMIIALPTGSGSTFARESAIINKRYVFIRGPGRDFVMEPNGEPNAATIAITAEGVEISGMQVNGFSGGTAQFPIHVDGADFTLLRNVWSSSSTDDGIRINDSAFCKFDRVQVLGATVDGIHVFTNTTKLKITDSSISSSGAEGINISGTGVAHINIAEGTTIFDNTNFGIKIAVGIDHTMISNNIINDNNTSGAVDDSASNTLFYGSDDLAATRIAEIWKLHGADIDNPMTVTPISRDAGAGVSQTISDLSGVITVTRNP